jgi:hypothetical protein
MSRLPIVVLSLLGFAFVLAGCQSTGTAFNPPGGVTTFKHMYLSNDAVSGEIFVYGLPVTAASTPVATVSAGTNPGELFVDSSGRLFVPQFSSTVPEVLVYNLPLTASSTPAFTLSTSQDAPESVAQDSSGNIYVADTDSGGYIDIYHGPVNGAASPSATISNNAVGNSGLKDPYDIAIAPNGDLYASDFDDINQFTPPFTAASVPSASAAPNQDNYGLRVDSNNRVFVANASADGILNVYTQPFTNASTPAFNISVSGTYLYGMAFDGSGNLWTVDDNGVVWEIKAPITSSSTATQILTGTTGYGIVFGP